MMFGRFFPAVVTLVAMAGCSDMANTSRKGYKEPGEVAVRFFDLRRGMTRNEVRELLGRPHRVNNPASDAEVIALLKNKMLLLQMVEQPPEFDSRDAGDPPQGGKRLTWTYMHGYDIELTFCGDYLTTARGYLPSSEAQKYVPAKKTDPVVELPKVPLGLLPVKVPEDNPMTAEKVELGKMLYFDTRLSKDGKISCATCHDPKMAWAEHKPTSTGIGGQVGGRNAPTVINAAYATAQFWDGREPTLEAQALGPIANPIEMGHELPAMVNDLNKIAAYKEHFQKVFGTDVTEDGVAKAIAAFERTVLSGNSPYDKFKEGDESALTDAQKRGLELFESAHCDTCHAQPLFSNYRYHNAGVGMDAKEPDIGRMAETKNERDKGAFRVVPLREVANTAPYFHDGSAATLEEAVALMAGGGKDNDNLSGMMKAVRSANLTEEDQKNIVEFLKALSGEYPIIEPPELP